jgi:hypothetical protein
MKKSERKTRANSQTKQKRKYDLQEEAMESFFTVCRSAMPPKHWQEYFAEAQATAGETFHIFDQMIFALAETQVFVTPQLRKSIDAVIDACEIERSRMRDLQRLNYDSYWKAQYGYANDNT